MIELILGGARSGKSALAEKTATLWRAENPLRQVIYVATAEARDNEMERRIAHHQARRPADWSLIEAPLDPGKALWERSSANTLVLVDCLTLWLNNLLFFVCPPEGEPTSALADHPDFVARQEALFASLAKVSGPVLLVSNEVGSGIVPMGALSRLFADEQGRLNQRVAAMADRVTLVVAGLPWVLKG